MCSTDTVGTVSGTLPTPGGALVDISGRHLGLTSSVVAMAYTGGSDGMARRTHPLPAGACTVVVPGASIRCPTLPGVGANFSFVVTVDGGDSAPSADTLSYSPPIIYSVDGPGAANGPAAGGVAVRLRGVCYRWSKSLCVRWSTPPHTPPHFCVAHTTYPILPHHPPIALLHDQAVWLGPPPSQRLSKGVCGMGGGGGWES